MNITWSTEALYYMNREPKKAMMDFAKFLGMCWWNPDVYYGVHVAYFADAHYGEGLIFFS